MRNSIYMKYKKEISRTSIYSVGDLHKVKNSKHNKLNTATILLFSHLKLTECRA